MDWIIGIIIAIVAGAAGMIIMAAFCAKHIGHLKHWNRRLQRERDEFKKKYEALMKVEP